VFIEAKDDGSGGDNWTTGAIGRAKLQSNHYHQQTNIQVWDQKIGLGLAGLVLCCETRSYHTRRHNDIEWHSNFSSTIYSFTILVLEQHYFGDQQWRLLT